MGNNLTGKIPSLAGLKSLEKVFVNDNGFTSIDADFFTGLNSLQFVNLDNNPLRPWKIPFSLTNATSLAVFSAAICNLSGKIPDFNWRVTFPNLTALELSGNSLVGELPMSFAGSSVQILMLNGQNLSGSISVLTKMLVLTEVCLQENRFSGTMPDFSGRLTSLKLFNVRGNRLTGIVPYSLIGLKSLTDVALGDNLLQGPIPRFVAKGIRFDGRGLNSFCVDINSFCLDSCFTCDMRVNALLLIVEAFGYPVIFAESWKGNDPCNGMWVGVTCTGADITVINFKGMGLTGTISPYFAHLKALKVINLSHNNLSGTIPQELTELRKLKALDVSYNQLSGLVPDFRPNVVDTRKIVASVIGSLFGLLLIGFAIFLLIKKKKQYHKMHPQQHSGDQDALKITIGSLHNGKSESGRV
ncbi:unnamed protein product [Arabis nemorensis]|uniref:Leucine-rich repeat-containing N-terminal plant-type domain-containing protein n=1 Tax=Arabis nemorensis TaxID=586526 RepID=A0A565CW77_9BRAS|nr:unnamed protein product [Arabis nemorensis]